METGCGIGGAENAIDRPRMSHNRGLPHCSLKAHFEARRPASQTFSKNQEYSRVRDLLDWLDYNGFTVVSKPIKDFADESGSRKTSRLHPGILHHAH